MRCPCCGLPESRDEICCDGLASTRCDECSAPCDVAYDAKRALCCDCEARETDEQEAA